MSIDYVNFATILGSYALIYYTVVRHKNCLMSFLKEQIATFVRGIIH